MTFCISHLPTFHDTMIIQSFIPTSGPTKVTIKSIFTTTENVLLAMTSVNITSLGNQIKIDRDALRRPVVISTSYTQQPQSSGCVDSVYKWCIHPSYRILFRGSNPFYRRLFASNWNTIENRFYSGSVSDDHIAANFCTCHDNTAVVLCTKVCSDLCIRIKVSEAKFHWIWIEIEKPLVTRGPVSANIGRLLVNWRETEFGQHVPCQQWTRT